MLSYKKNWDGLLFGWERSFCRSNHIGHLLWHCRCCWDVIVSFSNYLLAPRWHTFLYQGLRSWQGESDTVSGNIRIILPSSPTSRVTIPGGDPISLSWVITTLLCKLCCIRLGYPLPTCDWQRSSS